MVTTTMSSARLAVSTYFEEVLGRLGFVEEKRLTFAKPLATDRRAVISFALRAAGPTYCLTVGIGVLFDAIERALGGI